MRLREIQFNLEEALPLLTKFTVKTIEGSAPVRIELGSLKSVREALNLIEKTGILYRECEALKSTTIGKTNLDAIQVPQRESNSISLFFNAVLDPLRLFVIALDKALPIVDTENVIYIKLPEIQNFSDLQSLSDKLKKAVQLPIAIEEIGGSMYLHNFDTGSKWFEVNLNSAISMALIASLLWSGAVVYKKCLEVKAFEEHTRKIDLANEHIEALIAANKKQMDILIEAEAKSIQKEFLQNSKQEDIERLKLSIKTFSELIEQGTQIQPALVAPEEVSNLFPDYSKLLLIESKQKLIDSK